MDGDGDMGFGFGDGVKNCKLSVNGSVGQLCGTSAEDSDFFIGGDVGERCGGGDISHQASRNCTFSTDNYQTFLKLKEMVPKERRYRPSNNRVILCR